MKEGALALTSINILKMSSVTFTIADKEAIVGKLYAIIEECITLIKVEKNEKILEELRCLEADTREKAYELGMAIYREQQRAEMGAEGYAVVVDMEEDENCDIQFPYDCDSESEEEPEDLFASLVAQANPK